MQNPSENQQLMEMFNDFPNELERLDDMIHDLQAQAEMCMGTDENVRRLRTIIIIIVFPPVYLNQGGPPSLALG